MTVWAIFSRVFGFVLRMLARQAHRKQGCDPGRLPERLGYKKSNAPKSPIWFHGASMGEVAQVTPLAQKAHALGHEVLITTTTQTSADWVAGALPCAAHAFAPIDTPRSVERFLAGWQPTHACFLEGDFWPNMVSGCASRDIPLALFNPRPSKTRARFKRAFGNMLQNFQWVTVKSDTLLADITSLGVRSERIEFGPDLKRPLSPPEPIAIDTQNRPVILAASTHAEDEAPVIAAFLAVKALRKDLLLVIAPRHLHRVPSILKQASDHALTTTIHSLTNPIDVQTDVYILDTTGDLPAAFPLAQFAIMGGSFGPQGGHNPWEAIVAGCPVLTGPNTTNFEQDYLDLSVKGAAKICPTPEALTAACLQLCDPVRLDQMRTDTFNLQAHDTKTMDQFLNRFEAFISP